MARQAIPNARRGGSGRLKTSAETLPTKRPRASAALVIPSAANGTAVIGINAATRCASLYQNPVSSRASQLDEPAQSMYKNTR